MCDAPVLGEYMLDDHCFPDTPACLHYLVTPLLAVPFPVFSVLYLALIVPLILFKWQHFEV